MVGKGRRRACEKTRSERNKAKIRQIGGVKHPLPDSEALLRLHHRLSDANGPSIDTRSLRPGQCFFALRGEKTDGHAFVRQAREAGAAFAVVDQSQGLEDLGDFVEVVPDVLGALQAAARLRRLELRGRVLGLTGSNGKTTTKELLAAALGARFHVFATPGNLNNHIGLPLCLLQAERDAEFIVLEMGDNRTGDIAELCEIGQPDDGLITNVGQDHLEGYEGMAGNARTKMELFDYVNAKEGLIFLNAADEWLRDFPAKHRIEYGTQGKAVWTTVAANAPGGLTLLIHTPLGAVPARTKLTGAYNAENVAAVAAVALHYGVPLGDIARAIEGYQPRNQRSQLIETPGRRVIADCYNANPSSMRAALESLNAYTAGPLALVLGEMMELGAESESLHRGLAPLIRSLHPAVVIGVGRGILPLLEDLQGLNCHYYEDSAKAAADADELLRGCTLALVKGSRSVRLERVLEALS